MKQTRREKNKNSISKNSILLIVLLVIIIILILIFLFKGGFGNLDNNSVTQNTSQTIEKISLSSSLKQESVTIKITENLAESSVSTENSDNAKYPKITKELLNGHSWYEGNSTGIENQPRQQFYDNEFQDLFGNSLEYSIIVDDKEETYKVLDFRKNEIVDIGLKTKVKVNQPTVAGTYRDVYYYLYYKYDGTLMIAREGVPTEESDLTSYPLDELTN